MGANYISSIVSDALCLRLLQRAAVVRQELAKLRKTAA